MSDPARAVLGFVRTLISLFFVSTLVWCSFTVPLGGRTFAEHIDRIGQTHEAKDLMQGTRARLTPILEEMKHRLLGEYVEAPTFDPPGAPTPPNAREAARISPPPSIAAPSDPNTLASARPRPRERSATVSPRGPSTATNARLPGKRREPSLPAASLARP
jgi:hypothetical protein